jgi:hypothetical protein
MQPGLMLEIANAGWHNPEAVLRVRPVSSYFVACAIAVQQLQLCHCLQTDQVHSDPDPDLILVTYLLSSTFITHPGVAATSVSTTTGGGDQAPAGAATATTPAPAPPPPPAGGTQTVTGPGGSTVTTTTFTSGPGASATAGGLVGGTGGWLVLVTPPVCYRLCRSRVNQASYLQAPAVCAGHLLLCPCSRHACWCCAAAASNMQHCRWLHDDATASTLALVGHQCLL